MRLRRLLLPISVIVASTFALAGQAAAAPFLDASFGAGGKVTTPFGYASYLGGTAIQADGKIIAVGNASNGNNLDWKIARYNPDGTLDPAFGSGGVVTRDFGIQDSLDAVALQADGKIVVGGYSQPTATSRWTVARFNPDGTPDSSFGTGGIVTSFPAMGSNVLGVEVQQDSKIVVVGYTNTGGGDDIAVARYNPDGSPDPTFGNGGTVTTPVSTSVTPNDRGNAAAIQPDGKIVVFGDFDADSHDNVFLDADHRDRGHDPDLHRHQRRRGEHVHVSHDKD